MGSTPILVSESPRGGEAAVPAARAGAANREALASLAPWRFESVPDDLEFRDHLIELADALHDLAVRLHGAD
jgi:hypothetical protein